MLIKTREQLSKLTVSELKSICKANNSKGFSTLKKADLIEFTYNSYPSTFNTPLQYVFNDNLQMFSITHIDYINLSIKDIVSLLKEHASGKMFSNQSMNEKEVKAFYRAGFRVRHNETLSEAQTIELFHKTGSVQMVANTTKFNIIEVIEEVVTIEEETNKNEIIETNTNEPTIQEESYTVFNRTFTSYSEAVNYCNDNDFDLNLMLTTNNKQINISPVYWYEYTLRGFSLGCQPYGFIEHNDKIGRHGIIAYDRPLTNEELNSYELRPHSALFKAV